MVYLLIAWWIFPWRTVSHNQMADAGCLLLRIQDPERWGGGIELAILAAHYSTEPGVFEGFWRVFEGF